VRQVRLRIAHALDDRELARFPARVQLLQRRVQARAVRELHHLVAGDGDAWAQRGVEGIAIGHDGVEAVVAAPQLHQDEQPARRLGQRGGEGA
jgi:hypothetical protein